MASKIIRVKPDVADCNLSCVRLDGGVCLNNLVILEHIEESSLSSVVQAQEDNVCIFLKESKPLEGTFEEIYDKHFI
jgi:hypothetical protein